MTTTGHRQNCATLRYVYEDFDRLAGAAANDIVLHPAGRSSSADDIHGLVEVLAHERGLLAATEGTLVMDVEHITATEHFGTVLGLIRAQAPAAVAMPFCGVWRFSAGTLVEHWENPYSFADLVRHIGHH